ncbi:hypothetical protein BGZ60DRAFT_420312 [Tricladium varicosporioides]|nr:hypothetical protein BGZ60DRAFT_420312 [Hymenoscyphus varicosporioides]
MSEITGFDWVDSSVLSGVDATFSKTFCSEKDSNLQIRRLRNHSELNGDSWDHELLNQFLWTSKDIKEEDELQEFSECADQCQIFCIRQKHSYSRLYITRSRFKELLHHYNVFSRIWDFLLPFSFKVRESDLVNAPFRFRNLEPQNATTLGSFECAYGYRYVELNHRDQAKRENPDYDPWSVRQSAVYQQYNSEYKRIMFILITPSETARKNLEKAILHASENGRALNAFDLHRILISTLHENWRLYIRSLESLMTKQSERVTLAAVQNEDDKLSPLTDFAVNFVDRQRLKMIEDKVLDLVIVFESLYNTLSKLRDQCRSHCLGSQCRDCTCYLTNEELEEQMHEAQVNLKKVDILHKRAQGTAQLLSDLLDYENAQIAHLNEKALNGLVRETKEENSRMRVLTERSTADAAAVKILTIITLIYLPVTVVANFFSSQLIHVDEIGNISVVLGAYWFAIISIPLTIFTLCAWQFWLRWSAKNQDLKSVISVKSDGEKGPDSLSCHIVESTSRSKWRYVLDRKSRKRAKTGEDTRLPT